MSENQSPYDRAAKVARFVLVAAILVVVALLITAPKSEIYPGGPFMMRPAVADVGGGVSAAPGFLALMLGSSTSDKLYLVDTINKVICVYSVVNDHLRLV